MDFTFKVLKPKSATVSVYVPGGRTVNLKLPFVVEAQREQGVRRL